MVRVPHGCFSFLCFSNMYLVYIYTIIYNCSAVCGCRQLESCSVPFLAMYAAKRTSSTAVVLILPSTVLVVRHDSSYI